MSATCRFCGTLLKHIFADLGMSPLANSYLEGENLSRMEPFYPLKAYVCHNCYLVQLEEIESPKKIFSDYAYFSSYSDSWLKHAKQFVNNVIDRFNIEKKSNVIEIASNDGYLLQYFKEKGISVLGIEPAENVAEVAKRKGIPTNVEFFSSDYAQKMVVQGKTADLLIGNNVLAHVPNLRDFVLGLKTILNASGIITMEFPHLLKLMKGNQFDTIYHEHFSYFSLITVNKIFKALGLDIFDVEELQTHGGSLRIYIKHQENREFSIKESVNSLLAKEELFGLNDIKTYLAFNKKVKKTKRDILQFLIKEKNKGKKIVGYGAPAKGNTLLNYCGVSTDFFDYTVDRNPYKQGLYLPGTHIPIFNPEKIFQTKPDFVVILPWNLKEEIMEQLTDVRQWNGKFVIPIPKVKVM